MFRNPLDNATPAQPGLAQPEASPGLIGVLGGMGPLATVDFMQKMLESTPATRDQEHIPALVSSIPQIPDRTEAFQGRGASPLPALLKCAARLKAGGASLLVMPCNTAHLWFEAVEANVGIPMLNIVDAALEEASAAMGDSPRIGLLATEATMASGLYVNRVSPAMTGKSVQWLLPTDTETVELVTPGIAAVKAGKVPQGRALLLKAALALQQRGATTIVLGCTEIPIVLNDENSPVPTIDATAALARRTVEWSQNARSISALNPLTCAAAFVAAQPKQDRRV